MILLLYNENQIQNKEKYINQIDHDKCSYITHNEDDILERFFEIKRRLSPPFFDEIG